MVEWKPIETAPKDGTEIIILINSVTVPIVRSAWWNDGVGCDFEPDIESRGWWSYRHSVTQEMLCGHNAPVAWIDMPDESEWMDIFPPC